MPEKDSNIIGQETTLAPETAACRPPAKWAATVDDALVLEPRQLTARLLKEEAGVNLELVLARDYGSPNDVPLEDETKIDLGEGNVFYLLPRCDLKQPEECPEKPKFAFIVDDRPEET